MAETKKFLLAKEPFIRKADASENTARIMRDFVIALLPLVLFAWVKNGWMPFLAGDTNVWGLLYPLVLVIVGTATSTLLEIGWYAFIITDQPLKDRMKNSFAPIPGLLLSMIVPLATPIWTLIIVVFFATVIGKLIFGGFGHNMFNPALIGYLFLTLAFPLIYDVAGPNSFGAASFFNGSEAIWKSTPNGEIFAGATPLDIFERDIERSLPGILEQYSLLDMFIGFRPGSLAETSGLLCLIALGYLLVRRVTTWRIPVVYLATVFILTFVIGLFHGYGLEYPLFNLFSGGLMFGAVFMASEPVTSPRNPNGKIIYAIGIGVMTVVFRFASGLPEGVAISILIMNMFTPLIERIAAKLRVEGNKRKVVIAYSFIGLLFLGIGAFPVASAAPKTIELVSKEQNLMNLNFDYYFTVNNEEVKVTTNTGYEITKVGVKDFNNDFFKLRFSEIIKKNRIDVYVTGINETFTDLTVFVRSRGYSGMINTEVVFDNENKLTEFRVASHGEDYASSDTWSEENGDPITDMPGRIVAGRDNIDGVQVIAGATTTSEALKAAAKHAMNYVQVLSQQTRLMYAGKVQDMETMDFVYIFRNQGGKLIARTNTNYELLNADAIDDAIEEEVIAKISENKFTTYIRKATTAGEATDLEIVAPGYSPVVVVTVTVANGRITAVSPNTENESYQDGHDWSGVHPKDVMPQRIIDHQDNLDEVETVAGATLTSNAIKNAARLALEYIAAMEEQNE